MSNKTHHEFGSRALTQPLHPPVLVLLLLVAASLWSGCRSSQPSITPLAQASPLQTFTGVMTDPRFRVVHRALESRDQRLSEIPSLDTDELWVIARSSDPVFRRAGDSPGSGSLMAVIEDKQVPMPLKHTDVRASVSGYIGAVQVVQQFHNPYSNKIEAVYVFPLPHNAAVNEFIMTIGERRIRGIIRERREAEAIYAQAKAQGYVASLLTEERPNIFTQSVANIEPGKQIDVTIRYFHTLEYGDGWYEFVFPMVVGPRFNPPGTTDGVGAVARGEGGSSGRRTEVQYLKPGERSGHDIALRLEVDAGVPIEDFRCLTDDVDYEAPSAERMTVTLKSRDALPNRDFVFRYRVAGGKVKANLITRRDEREQFFTLILYPPQEVGRCQPADSFRARGVRRAVDAALVRAATEFSSHVLKSAAFLL
ncbi:MAG TPA: VIT domain-containing protein [Verrucomicrobiota bacterium]|nr:VIT domain-containing protein [Verrucomicrobiota bacterium]